MQQREFGGPRRRKQVFPCREHLTEFYERRTQLLEGESHAPFGFEMSDVRRFAPMQNLSGALEQRRDARATHDVAEPMPNENRADLAQPR